MGSSIFVSYSRSDAALARSVVQLLRARDDVFHDVDSIRPGAQWRQAIREAVDSAALIYVLWCSHSAASIEVRSELDQARERGKPIVPVLLDSTPLNEDLSRYQWVDLSHATIHEQTPPPRPGASLPLSSRKLGWKAAAAMVALVIIPLVLTINVLTTLAPGDTPPPSTDSGPGLWIGMAAVVLALLTTAWWRVRRARRRRSSGTELATDGPEVIADRIAADLRNRR